MRAVLWGGPDDGREMDVPDTLVVIEQTIDFPIEALPPNIHPALLEEMAMIRRYHRCGWIARGRTVFKIERCAP